MCHPFPRCKCLAGLAVVLTLVLAPAALSAQVASISSPATPEGRLGQYLDSLNRFVESNPGLEADQAAAVWEAVRAAEPGLFVNRPGAQDRQALTERLNVLQDKLSCTQFGAILEGFGGVHDWMVENQIAAAATCNCGGNDDCSTGYTCVSVNCTSPAGTTHWGVCRKGSISVEPEDPVASGAELEN